MEIFQSIDNTGHDEPDNDNDDDDEEEDDDLPGCVLIKHPLVPQDGPHLTTKTSFHKHVHILSVLEWEESIESRSN